MRKILLMMTLSIPSSVFAATLTANTVPYVCQGGTTPQLCSSNMTTDASGNVLHVQVFTSSGAFSVPLGISKVFLSGCGGGADGGSGATSGSYQEGSGGGSGQCIENYPYGVTAGSNITVTINGDNGSTVFGNLTLAAGSAGSRGVGPGGSGANMFVNSAGDPVVGYYHGVGFSNPGEGTDSTHFNTVSASGYGASSPFGTGGTPPCGSATGYGAGGAGGAGCNGSGTGGIMVVTW